MMRNRQHVLKAFTVKILQKKKKKDSQITDITAKIMAKSVKVIYEGFDT